METWYLILILILVSISTTLLLKALNYFLFPYKNNKKRTPLLPPGPRVFPIIGNTLWLRKSMYEFEPIIRSLQSKLGPMVTLRIGSRISIVISDRSLAHKALIQNGAVFSDRGKPVATNKITSSNQHTISTARYGPTWRLLRRNLTSEILHPSRVKSFSHARNWVLQILLDRLRTGSSSTIQVMDHFQYAMFCLLVLMCFGDKLQETKIKEIERVQRNMLLNALRFGKLNIFPRVTKIILWKTWKEFLKLRKDQEDVIIPLIRSAREKVISRGDYDHDHYRLKEGHVSAYVDTLFDLELPEERRMLNEGEMVSLCSEFLNAGTDTTSTALQWIMASLVKYPRVQDKLFGEIKDVVVNKEEVEEEDLKKMRYLKAVVLEGLRRHPPGHFLLQHKLGQDVVLGGFLVPKNASVNFMVADIGWDPAVWDDPMEFRPERFLVEEEEEEEEQEFDITGSKGIKMMPFGVGRRMCPGYGLAMLHLEYFVANLVWRFEWKAVEGIGVDLSEKQEFTTVMKYPLQVHLLPRF